MFSNRSDRLKLNVLRLRCTTALFDHNNFTLNEYNGGGDDDDDDDDNDDDDDVYSSLIIHVRFSQII